jgi:hypothetical protein
MKKSLGCVLVALTVVLWLPEVMRGRDKSTPLKPEFHTSDRCLACHNQLTTPSGRDVSIGLNWRSSIMANSARDPYWQASVRREILDHPEAERDIEDECSVCHMPVSRYQAKLRGEKGEVFAYLPFSDEKEGSLEAQDGVTCTICHQISKEKLGTRESFNGGFVIQTPATNNDRSEYGPFAITTGNQHIMNTSTGGFLPSSAEHIRDSALCGSCHQLYTTARDGRGKVVGTLPEQMPYLEWLHSDYPGKSSCQGCHMPEVPEQVQVSSVLGVLRSGLHQHVFVGGNFLMQRMLNRYRNELGVAALPNELTTAADEAINFLQSQSARVSLENVNAAGGKLQAEVVIQNLTGHKLPTAYPSRRAWLHFLVRDHNGQTVFESGGLNPDGSIQGNDNDTDKSSFEPHYREISMPDQVEIFESILKDSESKVTTGLIAAVGYLKDNRLLPTGFDKTTAEKDIAVIGDAAEDPTFVASGDRIRYSVVVGNSGGPYQIKVELLYQPIGFRWAHNLSSYQQTEPQRFVRYYESMASSAATILAHAEATK